MSAWVGLGHELVGIARTWAWLAKLELGFVLMRCGRRLDRWAVALHRSIPIQQIRDELEREVNPRH